MAQSNGPTNTELLNRVERLELEQRSLQSEMASMQVELRERLASLESKVTGLCQRFDDRFQRPGQQPLNGNGQARERQDRFERLWGGLLFGAWAVFIAVVSSGTVVAIVQYLSPVVP